jgi:hypothetical protein
MSDQPCGALSLRPMTRLGLHRHRRIAGVANRRPPHIRVYPTGIRPISLRVKQTFGVGKGQGRDREIRQDEARHG